MHTYRPPSDSCGPEQTVTMNSSTKWTTTDTTAHFTEHLFISEKLEGRVVLVTLYYILTQVFPLTVSLAFLLKVFHRKNRKRIISSIHSALCSTLPGTSYNNPTQRKLEMCANDTAGTFSKTTSCILSNCQKSVPALLHRRKKNIYIYRFDQENACCWETWFIWQLHRKHIHLMHTMMDKRCQLSQKCCFMRAILKNQLCS